MAACDPFNSVPARIALSTIRQFRPMIDTQANRLRAVAPEYVRDALDHLDRELDRWQNESDKAVSHA